MFEGRRISDHSVVVGLMVTVLVVQIVVLARLASPGSQVTPDDIAPIYTQLRDLQTDVFNLSANVYDIQTTVSGMSQNDPKAQLNELSSSVARIEDEINALPGGALGDGIAGLKDELDAICYSLTDCVVP